MQPTVQTIEADQRQRERDIEHLLQLEPWVEPRGIRRTLRNIAIALRGREQQEHLERTWRIAAAQRRLNPKRGW
ncbi:MAG: hypothetical protein M0R74_06600 [Dehalococcoidia bacterium]|nr:hypothetical protein [Dehalococcoidia bacterium]